MALKVGWINSWRRRLSKATSPDGYVLPPLSEAVSLCTPFAGEHGQDGSVALMTSACGFPLGSWLATV